MAFPVTAAPRMPRAHLRPLVPALLLALALLQLLAFWPGILVWDAIRQYGQALSGHYDDWHPPAMNWLWRQLGVFGRGPAPMLVLQWLLYWGGFAALMLHLVRARRLRRIWAVLVLAAMPVALVLTATILKDSLMAGALLAATACIAWRRQGDRLLAAIATLLLLGAATLRFNAVPACLPLALLLVPDRWTARPVRLALVALALAVPLVLVLPLANRALDARRSHVELSLIIYDLGGITRFSGEDVFPKVAVADPVTVNRSCYSPVSWDSYAWWTDTPCPVGWENVGGALVAPGVDAPLVWLRALAMHPIAYAMHRFAHFNQDIRFATNGKALPPLSLESDPNDWGYQVPPGPIRGAIEWLATASLATPLGWPACWLALAGSVLLLGTGGNRLATALAASSLLYAMSYLPLGVASEVRYHLWTMLAAGLAAILGLRTRPAVARWRIHAAIALPVIVTLFAGAFRLFG